MSTVLVRRPARKAVPEVSSAPIAIAAPPQLPDAQSATMNMAMVIMPMMSGSGALMMALTNPNRPLYAAAGLLMLVASVGLGIVMWVSMRSGPKRKLREQRERYLDYLEDVRGVVRKAARVQRAAAALRHPHPELLPDLAGGFARRWERRVGDRDLLTVRCGLARVPLTRTLTLNIDNNPLNTYDPVCQSSAEELVDRYATVGAQPLTVPLGRYANVAVVGDYAHGRAAARAMLTQLATLVSPDDVRVAVVRHRTRAEHWHWLTFLPHVLAEGPGSGPLPHPLICDSTGELGELLAEDLHRRAQDWRRRRGGPPGPGTQHLVIVIDGEQQVSISGMWDEEIDPAELGVHVLSLVAEERQEPERLDARVKVTADGSVTAVLDLRAPAPAEGEPHLEIVPLKGALDVISEAEAAGVARALSPFRLAEAESGEALHAVHGLTDILGVTDPATVDVGAIWRSRRDEDALRVPIGVGADGEIVDLDLKESALGGMGPHGLIVGATGSGKSEALRTLVAALAVRHDPERLALLTVDFKGGATFADLDPLPHNAGSITNLADDLALVDRFREALYGEMMRRQQLLKDSGNLPNVHAYARLRKTRPELAPLPHLLVIIDEFSELLTAKPDFAELFVAVGRIGRSIGVHLLLATQRLDGGAIRGLESHLSYRIGLRTFSESESRDAIGVPDAYRLPPEPGSGYLKVDTSVFTRFKAAMVSGAYEPPREDNDDHLPILPWPPPPSPLIGLTQALAAIAPDTSGGHAAPTERTILQVLVERLAGAGAEAVRPVWLPPLPEAMPLDAVPTALDKVEDPARVTAIIGLHDSPREQRQKPLEWDLTGADANLAVYGAPVSGKSTLIRTLVANLALRYEPGQIACYIIDYGGGALAPLAALPHVAAVATRAEPELMRRVIADVKSMLDSREAVMQRLGLDSAARLRRARATGEVPASVAGDVLFIVDGWGALRDTDYELEDPLIEIAGRGPALGVHTVITAVNQTQVRARLAANIGGRVELRLSDPFDSGIERKLAEALPKETPGRVLWSDENYGHVALPRVDGSVDVEDLPAGIAHLAREVSQRWTAPPVPPVRVLPGHVTAAELVPPYVPGEELDPYAMRPVIGLSERDLGPARIDFDTDPHLIVYGDPQTGKSSVVTTIIKQLMRRPVGGVGIMMVDFRRAHLEEIPDDYELTYCTGAAHAAQNATELAAALKKRLPGPDVTAQQLRERSWWKGYEVFLVIDDYDLVATGGGNPLAPLMELIPQGRDLGFHVILSRRTGGASRALYEPFLQTLSDMSPPTLMFSGDRMEGRLAHGVAPQRLPLGRALLTRRGEPAEPVQIAVT
ncbi:type VII secretion protein EccC [Actinorhabdospora filicis]|uniref:Type VII secretion protein EccC n=1 Tax=Actinorhabdospora filicis TaxID=1785913 RepID=A0A9W6W8H6_9ACTN|nr:type VII secretion protein EccCa [Actinorhabdospora filicis]GLZ76491.1 type VII secretion protein EccC [Actinorhabdospora filicis]